jgi:hypothetical protein
LPFENERSMNQAIDFIMQTRKESQHVVV